MCFPFAERLHARQHVHIFLTLQCTLIHTCRTQQLDFSLLMPYSRHFCSVLSHADASFTFCNFVHSLLDFELGSLLISVLKCRTRSSMHPHLKFSRSPRAQHFSAGLPGFTQEDMPCEERLRVTSVTCPFCNSNILRSANTHCCSLLSAGRLTEH